MSKINWPEIISKKFDVNVSFISALTTNPSEIVYFETVRRNSGAPLIVTYNNMLVPVRVEGSLVGAIRVSDISHLNAIELGKIKQTIDLVLEDNYIAQNLPRVDEILDELTTNVIPFPKAASDELVAAR